MIMVFSKSMDQLTTDRENNKLVTNVIVQHVGFSLKQEDPSYESFSTEERISHTLFPKTQPHCFENQSSW